MLVNKRQIPQVAILRPPYWPGVGKFVDRNNICLNKIIAPPIYAIFRDYQGTEKTTLLSTVQNLGKPIFYLKGGGAYS